MEEDSGGITRLLLAIIADSLARQGARMSDTITLHTRILLTTQDLYSKRLAMEGPAELGTLKKIDGRETWLK